MTSCSRCCHSAFSFIVSCPSENWAGGWGLSLFITVRNCCWRGSADPLREEKQANWTSQQMDMRLPPPSLCSHVSAQIVQVTTSSRHARRSAWISFRRWQQTLPPLIVVRLLSACQCSRPAVGEEGREIPQPKTNIQVQRRGDKCVWGVEAEKGLRRREFVSSDTSYDGCTHYVTLRSHRHVYCFRSLASPPHQEEVKRRYKSVSYSAVSVGPDAAQCY